MSCQKSLEACCQRELVQYLEVGYGVSQRRACRVLGGRTLTVRYQSIAVDRADLRVRLKDMAASRPRYGYRRLHLLLERQGVQANHKLVYRLYREEGLGIRSKRPKRRKSCQVRAERVTWPRSMTDGAWILCRIHCWVGNAFAC